MVTVIGGVLGIPALFLLVAAPAGMGLAVGAAQWWVLRRRVPDAWRWWLACGFSGLVGESCVFLFGRWVIIHPTGGVVLIGLTIEVISSGLTGWVLVRWLRPNSTNGS